MSRFSSEMSPFNSLKAAAAATAIALTLCGCLFASEYQNLPPVVTLQPADIHTKAGEGVTFETRAEGDGLTFQWYYKKPDSPNWTVWKGHESAVTSAEANSTWNGMRVYCRVTDSRGNSVATRPALISLCAPAVILAQPRDVTVNLGETAYFRVSARGEGKLRYQWYYRKGNTDLWTKWKGHTSSQTEAVANDSWNGMRLFCLVTDSAGSSVGSDPATVTVVDSPTFISQPGSVHLNVGGSSEFSVTGGTEGLLCQWFVIPCGFRFGVKMKNRNDLSFSVDDNESLDGAKVFCRLKSPGGSMVYSERAEITAADKPFFISHPQPVAARTGGNMYFSAKADGDGINYKWYFRYADSHIWRRLAGYSGSCVSLTAMNSLSGGEIRCEVTDSRGNRAVSAPASVSVCSGVNITRQPDDVTALSGGQFALCAAADSEGAEYQWYARKDGSGWTALVGHVGSIFTATADPSMHGMRLKCKITAPDGSSAFSREACVTINDVFTLRSSPENIVAHSGENVEFSVNASGSGLKYQWLMKTGNSGGWKNWQGQTSAKVRLPAELSWHKTQMRCDVTDRTGKLLSSGSADVWITDALDILRQPRSISLKAAEPAVFSVRAQGEGLRYQWYYKKRGMRSWHIWKNHTSPVTNAVANPSWNGMKVFCKVSDSRGKTINSKYAVVKLVK